MRKKLSLRKLRDELSKKEELLSNQKSQNFLHIIMEFKAQENDGFLNAEEDVFIRYKELSIVIPKTPSLLRNVKKIVKLRL